MNTQDNHGSCCRCGEFYCNQPVLYPLGRNRLIYVDRCLIPELQSLWLRGIETGGCCCGHFEDDGFIQVFPEQMDAMRELGYEEIPPIEIDGHIHGECAFKPKTKLEFHSYMDVKTELMQNYERLSDVARNLYQLSSDLLKNRGRNDSFYLRIVRTQLEELGIDIEGENDGEVH